MNQITDGLNLIDGEWLPGEEGPWERTSPADGRPVWNGRWSSVCQTETAVAAAKTAFPAWAQTSLEHRVQLCQAFARRVSERKDELAQRIAIENGKPGWEAKTEVAAAIAKVSNSIDAITKRRWTTSEQLGDFQAVTRYRPHGVMFVLGPFNFPAHIPGGHIIPALLAGNTVVFKPSEWVPATGQWLAEIWHSIGLPSGVLNLVHGGGEVGSVATSHDAVDGVLFTGSHKIGTELHRRMAGKPEKILALEMGGNNPLVVHGTSDIRGAAITTILSAFITSGQRCTCTRRLIVTGQECFEKLVGELLALIPKIRVGLSLDEPQPFMGPLIHAQAATAMLAAEHDLIAGGAKSLIRMESDPRSPALVTPALLEIGEGQETDDCEHFGPMLTLQRADDLDHAIKLANATRFGLSAGFLGDKVDDFHYFLDRIRAGVVNWNRQTTGASGKLPFGGVGLSGNHRPSGYFAADYCSYPMASLESPELSEARQPVPGLEFGSSELGNAD